MSLVGQPEYWRRRVGMLLVSAGVFTAEREFAQALLRRLARIPQWQGASDSQRPCTDEVGRLQQGPRWIRLAPDQKDKSRQR